MASLDKLGHRNKITIESWDDATKCVKRQVIEPSSYELVNTRPQPMYLSPTYITTYSTGTQINWDSNTGTYVPLAGSNLNPYTTWITTDNSSTLNFNTTIYYTQDKFRWHRERAKRHQYLVRIGAEDER